MSATKHTLMVALLTAGLLGSAAASAEPIVRSFAAQPGGELEVNTDVGRVEVTSLSLIHISEPTRHTSQSRMPSCA